YIVAIDRLVFSAAKAACCAARLPESSKTVCCCPLAVEVWSSRWLHPTPARNIAATTIGRRMVRLRPTQPRALPEVKALPGTRVAPRAGASGGVALVVLRTAAAVGRACTVHPVAQLLAGPEEQPPLRLHRDHLPRLGVAALVALVVLDVKGPKSADLDVFSAAERVLHRLEDGLDRGLGLLLRDAALRHQNVDQVALQHRRDAPSTDGPPWTGGGGCRLWFRTLAESVAACKLATAARCGNASGFW